MKLKKAKQKASVALILAMLGTSVAPAQAFSAWDDILDEDALWGGLEEDDDDDDATPGDADKATPDDATPGDAADIATPGVASPSTPSNWGRWDKHLKYQENDSDEPVIGATAKEIIEVDGKYYKDSNGNGELDAYEDWTLDPEERAEDLVSQMTVDDKIGMMFNNSRGLGKGKKKVDETGLLDETENKKDTSIFGVTSTLGTTDTIKELKLRHFILRENPNRMKLHHGLTR